MIVQDSPAQEAVKREMYRESQDDCMIYNPTENDFYIDWEEYHHLVPNKNRDIGWGNGKREVKRFLADWYCRHMKDQIINELGDKEAQRLLQKRSFEGKEEYTDFFVKSNEVYSKVPRTDDRKLMSELYPTLFLGVVREFGLDLPEQATSEAMDDKSTEEKVMEQLKKLKYVDNSEKMGAPDVIKPTVNAEAFARMTPKEKAQFEKEVTV